MAKTDVKCPKCGSINVIKHGTTQTGYQRYYCKNQDCKMKSFQLEHIYRGCHYGIESQIVEMTANVSGIRDISRVLKITTYKVMDVLKNKGDNQQCQFRIYSKAR